MALPNGGTTPEIATSLAALAGLSSQATPATSANTWAGWKFTKFGMLELVGALNLKAGNDSTTLAKMPKEMDGVCNQLNGSVGLTAKVALAELAAEQGGVTWAADGDPWSANLNTWAVT